MGSMSPIPNSTLKLLSELMKCPECAAANVTVVTTAYATEGQIVRRRRCHACEHRWYTIQEAETLLLPGTFRWIERCGRRRAVKLIDAVPSDSL